MHAERPIMHPRPHPQLTGGPTQLTESAADLILSAGPRAIARNFNGVGGEARARANADSAVHDAFFYVKARMKVAAALLE